MSERRHAALVQIALASLGAVAIVVGPWLSRALGHPLLMLIRVVGVGIVAGGVEAAATRRTGRRRWLGSWLPSTAGVVAATSWAIVHDLTRDPPAPDGGVAAGVAVLAMLVGVPSFAVFVRFIAEVA